MLGDGSVVVTVFPDDNKKYLSTDLLKKEPPKETFLSPEIELINFRAFKRVCYTCCDPIECFEKDLVGEEEDQLPYCPRRLTDIP